MSRGRFNPYRNEIDTTKDMVSSAIIKANMGQGRLPGISKLTAKQRRFLDDYLITGNATQSAINIYGYKSRSIASSRGSDMVKQLNIPLETLMDSMGLSKGKLIQKVKQKMESTKIHSSPTDPDREVPDNPSQLKAVEIAGKWLGVDKGSQVNVQVNVPILGGKSND